MIAGIGTAKGCTPPCSKFTPGWHSTPHWCSADEVVKSVYSEDSGEGTVAVEGTGLALGVGEIHSVKPSSYQ